MRTAPGSNHQDVKVRNRLLVLQLIATSQGVSRVDLAKLTGLTKMTIGNIVAGLLQSGVVAETETADPVGGNYGRRPVLLKIAPEAPCICGMLIKRGLCQVVLAGLDGVVFAQNDYEYAALESQEALIAMLRDGFRAIVGETTRRIIAIGISSVGPIDAVEGIIRDPPYFYGIENVPITSIMEEFTALPTFLINDANAGALAENLFGIGRQCADFVYMHIMNGVGAGLVLQGSLYNGDAGVSGEIGHTSISFAGPRCACGNTGCLEMYANIDNINAKIRHMRGIYPNRSLLPDTKPYYQWQEVISAASEGDYYAISALDDFCEYLSHALANAINLLDINTIIVGYESRPEQKDLETILSKKLNSRVLTAPYREIAVRKSVFGGDAPLIGSIALVTNKFFSGQIEF